jgi:hypothetical protein
VLAWSVTVQIKSNFIADIRSGLLAELRQLGHEVPAPTGDPYKDAHTVCMAHWNARIRRISRAPRAVHLSRELVARMSSLSQLVQSGLDVVTKELEAGDDMTPRLSRHLRQQQLRYDLMLNDWGIHHLHIDPHDRTKGAAEILFLIVDSAHAYFIDVRDHHAWTDSALVEIIHSNWPSTIEGRRIGAIKLQHSLTDAQRKNLRDKHGNAAIQMQDGTVYTAIGGGIVGSGANLSSVVWGDWLLATARSVEQFMLGQADQIADQVAQKTGSLPDSLELHLANLQSDHADVCWEHQSQKFITRIPIQKARRGTVDLTGKPKP